jgi:hypothetical protein
MKAFARNKKIFLNWNKMLFENGTKGAERESFAKGVRLLRSKHYNNWKINCYH